MNSFLNIVVDYFINYHIFVSVSKLATFENLIQTIESSCLTTHMGSPRKLVVPIFWCCKQILIPSSISFLFLHFVPSEAKIFCLMFCLVKNFVVTHCNGRYLTCTQKGWNILALASTSFCSSLNSYAVSFSLL